MEIFAFTQRQVQRHDAFTETFAHFGKGLVVIRLFGVHFIDKNHPRQRQFVTVIPRALRVHFDARFGGNDNEDAVARAQGRPHFTGKFTVARSIDEIQLVTFPFAGRDPQLNRDIAFDFFGLKIENMFIIGACADTFDRSGRCEQIFDHGCFTCPVVRQDRHITNLRTCIIFHDTASSKHSVSDLFRRSLRFSFIS